MDKPTIIFTLDRLAFPIQVIKTGNDRYLVQYGVEVSQGVQTKAAHKLGESIFHALGCDGKLDNEEG